MFCRSSRYDPVLGECGDNVDGVSLEGLRLLGDCCVQGGVGIFLRVRMRVVPHFAFDSKLGE